MRLTGFIVTEGKRRQSCSMQKNGHCTDRYTLGCFDITVFSIVPEYICGAQVVVADGATVDRFPFTIHQALGPYHGIEASRTSLTGSVFIDHSDRLISTMSLPHLFTSQPQVTSDS
jgi:hypothetical protein